MMSKMADVLKFGLFRAQDDELKPKAELIPWDDDDDPENKLICLMKLDHKERRHKYCIQ